MRVLGAARRGAARRSGYIIYRMFARACKTFSIQNEHKTRKARGALFIVLSYRAMYEPKVFTH